MKERYNKNKYEEKESYGSDKIHRAKKSLGQNFLKSQGAIRSMCQAGNLTKDDTVIEIGPGKGALTEPILSQVKKVIAIEKDYDLINFLKEKFETEIENKKLILSQGDCLEYEPEPYPYKIIANIPYNITGAIIKKYLDGENKPETMVLLVQKEVAERIVARDKKESILSLSVKIYGEPKYISKVGKKFFSPAPKVDSAIIAIYNITKKNDREFTEFFFKIIKAGFAHKRKVLKKNLESVLSKEEIADLFKNLELSDNTRAEDLSYPKWKIIVEFLKKKL